MTANLLLALVCVWIVLPANNAFWKLLFAHATGGHVWLFAGWLALWLFGLHFLLLRLISPNRWLRVILSFVVILAAADSWFMDAYGVAIDSGMVRNFFETDFAEARQFLGWPLYWRVIWQAGIPLVAIWKASLPPGTWQRSLRDYAVGAVVGLVLFIGAPLPMYSSFASFIRNQEVSRYLIAPANAMVATVTLARKTLHARQPYVQVGLDAHREAQSGSKPLLIVFVVGETARAANFSLGGYARDTNPLLQQRNIFYFHDVHSCGTATAVSVPCMFSDLPRTQFRVNQADHRDNVLDMLQRAGLPVTWIDNQSGCKGVCARVPFEKAQKYHPESCSAGECLDDALLFALDARLAKVTADSLLVLHAMGSHGPTYHHRVPPEREVFKPVCATEHIETCSDEAIRNSYDNSIVYTDYVLASLIDKLAARQGELDSLLLYVSDHGESLGENGLYLHGHPYAIAPEVQKRVPLLFWFSKDATARLGLDAACLREHLGDPISHDHVSHTLLGVSDVHTTVYRPELDVLRGCRSALAK